MVLTRTRGCDAEYCVEQGPEWLGGLLYNPPGWVYAAIAVVVVGALGAVVLAHRKEPLSQRDLRDALGSIAIVGGCGAGALLMQEWTVGGYLVDLVVGWGVGGGVGVVLARQIRTDEPETGEDSDKQVTS